MSFSRIKNHFSVGSRNPKAIYVHDPYKMLLEGFYLITDEDSCRKTLQYIEALNWEHMDLFVDDDRFPLPEFTPSILPIEMVHNNATVEEWERGKKEKRVDEHIETVEEIVGERAEIPMQCSRLETYVSPMGYVSEHDDNDGESSREDSGESNGENSSDDDGEIEADIDVPETIFFNVYNGQVIFALRMTFADAKKARAAIHEYEIKFGYKLSL